MIAELHREISHHFPLPPHWYLFQLDRNMDIDYENRFSANRGQIQGCSFANENSLQA